MAVWTLKIIDKYDILYYIICEISCLIALHILLLSTALTGYNFNMLWQTSVFFFDKFLCIYCPLCTEQ